MDWAAIAWYAGLLAPLIGMACIAALNMITFPRLHRSQVDTYPAVSILIPARNEADRIGETIRKLLTQDYPDYEVIVLDDESSDGTREVVESAAAGDPRVRVVDGLPLPEGWSGKPWACNQLARQAKGTILVFTDADVHWEPESLSALISRFTHSKAHLLSVWPTQETHGWAERLVVPMMAFTVLAYLPEILVRHCRWTSFSAANGQCMVFRKAAYERIGGHESVRSTVLEDVRLARLVKRSRFRLAMADANGLIRCRMYRGWDEVRDGFAKNLLAGHGGSPLFLAFSALFHWTWFLMPWIALPIAVLLSLPVPSQVTLATMIVLACAVRALTAMMSRQRIRDSLLMPVSTVLMTLIAWRSLVWHMSDGGPRWKGRILNAREE